MMKDDIAILLERRKEILKDINKLEKEYSAIGNIITKILKIAEEENISKFDEVKLKTKEGGEK